MSSLADLDLATRTSAVMGLGSCSNNAPKDVDEQEFTETSVFLPFDKNVRDGFSMLALCLYLHQARIWWSPSLQGRDK